MVENFVSLGLPTSARCALTCTVLPVQGTGESSRNLSWLPQIVFSPSSSCQPWTNPVQHQSASFVGGLSYCLQKLFKLWFVIPHSSVFSCKWVCFPPGLSAKCLCWVCSPLLETPSLISVAQSLSFCFPPVWSWSWSCGEVAWIWTG